LNPLRVILGGTYLTVRQGPEINCPADNPTNQTAGIHEERIFMQPVASFSPEDRERFTKIQELWKQSMDPVPFIPEPYIFLQWLRQYDYRSLKTAVKVTASWVQRRLLAARKDSSIKVTEDAVIRYCSAVARNTVQAKADAAALQGDKPFTVEKQCEHGEVSDCAYCARDEAIEDL
jgi:hypothetical protein